MCVSKNLIVVLIASVLAGSSLAQGSQLTLNDILSAEEQQELGFDELTLKQRV